jgi:drug/metabolite transporter (DMT)-like permease
MIAGSGAGLALAVAAAGCFEGGYVLQALEARGSPPAPGPRLALLARLARRRRWLAGIALSGVGVALQALALLVAPLSAVQPALALGLVLLLVLARRVLGERVGRREVAGAMLIVAGVTVVALCAPGRHTGGGSALAIAVTMVTLGVVAIGPHLARRSPARLAVAATAAADVWAAVGLKLATDALSRGRLLVALAWGIGCAGAAVLALSAEMSALQRVAAARVGPIVLAAQVVVPVALAPVIARESWAGTPGGGLVLGAGVAAVAAGAAILGASDAVGDVLFGRGGEPLEHDVGGVRKRGE